MKKDTGIVNIHGKEYQTVAYRVGLLREKFPQYTLKTQIVHRDENEVVMVASILDETGRLIATGHAEEQRKSSQINRTSALENCETSAIGRALAAFGLGGTEFASANEVENAIHQQKTLPEGTVQRPRSSAKPAFVPLADVLKELEGAFSLEDLQSIFIARSEMAKAHYSQKEVEQFTAKKDEMKKKLSAAA